MKYLTLLEDLDYRGSQRVAQNYSLGMKALGHDIRVLTINALGSRTEYLTQEGIVCSCIATQPESIDEISIWSPDIVHIHRSGIYDEKINQTIVELKNRVNPIVIETSIFSRVDYKIQPNIIDIHLHLTKWCLWKWLQWSKSLTYKPLATILPNSVISSLFYRSSTQDIIDCKSKLGIPQNNFIFGRVGANCEAKWHPIIVNGFENIAKTHNNVSLLLVSPPPSILKLVENLPINIKNQVFITPKIEKDGELRLLYSSMNVMLHGSRIGESFGIVLAESLLCETPSIVLSSPMKDNSQVEIIKHQQTGLVVNNAESFIQAMKEIYDCQDKAREFGKNGRKDIIDNYDNEYVCNRLNLLCKLLLDNRQELASIAPQLLNDNGFVTEVPNFMNVLDEFYGQVPIHEKIIAKLVHHPQIYRFYVNAILAAKFN
ncbi:glycosyltransferase family 4 protein [Chamaesiphon sp. OTE_20_metabat_361]|uniref:glycosyltransferase family 4 protein n=1 Tax=Chamaesiphon sp. OTE_20_metabat_361 TaxID=2964689 RepID=UPI002869F117|nr:glycosyltransferase family 4 protein [Chamaesiphon sp. OTE_20_metabat_361]